MENEKKINGIGNKSSKKIFLALAAIIVILGFTLVLSYRKSEEVNIGSANDINSVNGDNPAGKYQAKTDNQANVTVEVIPKSIGVNQEKNTFEISFNTHSVDLNFDFQKVIILKDNLGNKYEAIEWTGGKSGHHMNGNIVFPKIDSNAKSIEMEIDSVGGVTRIFDWEL